MIDYAIQLNTNEFREVVKKIVIGVEEIVETGTFHGNGSTQVFANTGKYVFSIECNYNNFVISSKNLHKYDNVCVVHGLSLNKTDLIRGLLQESFDISTTYDSKFPKTFYMREISHQVVLENALDVFCNNDRRQLIFLDSAGGVGYLEYKWLMSIPDDFLRKKIIMLDDISHIKHYRSVKDLINRGFQVNISKDNRFAWVDMNQGC